MSLTIKPLSPFGAEIVTTSDELLNSPTAPGEVRAALAEHSMLLLRGLDLDDDTQLQVGRRLGEIVVKHSPGWSDEFPGIYRVALDPSANDELYVKGSWDWHLDGVTSNGVPPLASLLTCRTAPGEGGETELISMYKAYDLLTDEEKVRFADLEVWHRVRPEFYTHVARLTPEQQARLDKEPAQLVPLVWTHDTGRKSLVIGINADRIEGMELEEGRALLTELLDRSSVDDLVLSHAWKVGDAVMWDNTGVLHRGRPYTAESGRDMHRFTLVGHESIR